MAAKRVKRLKDLIDLLERLPASPDRDRVLSEVRSRAVDVDTGVTPRAMLPVREPAPPPVLPRPPKRDRASNITRTAPPSPAPAIELARSPLPADRAKDLEQSLWVTDEPLSLEDSPLPHVRSQGTEPPVRGRSVCARSWAGHPTRRLIPSRNQGVAA